MQQWGGQAGSAVHDELGRTLEKEADVASKAFRADNRKLDAALASVTSGRIQVKIWLTDTSAEALAKLKAAGFAAKSSVSGRFITGEIDASRLAELVGLSFVQYVSKP